MGENAFCRRSNYHDAIALTHPLGSKKRLQPINAATSERCYPG